MIVVVVLLLLGGVWYLRRSSTPVSAPLPAASDVMEKKEGDALEKEATGTGEVMTEKEVAVTIQNFAFSPSTITVKKGTNVTWTNNDEVAHTVTTDTGTELDSQLLAKGKSFSHVFDTEGSFAYHCTPHPNMKATVVVE